MSYSNYTDQIFFIPEEKTLSNHVKVICPHCQNQFFPKQATLYCWPDRQESPYKGMVVICRTCGCRILLPESSTPSQTKISSELPNHKSAKNKRQRQLTLTVLMGCLLLLIAVGGFALKNVLMAAKHPAYSSSDIDPVSIDSHKTEPSDVTESEWGMEDKTNQNNDTVYELIPSSGVSGTLQKGAVADINNAVFENNSYSRADISRIEFLNSIDEYPPTAWDVSADHSGGILAWVDGSDCLYIASNGKIKLSGDCTGLFAYFTNVREIYFHGYVNTEDVTNMSLFFYHCTNLLNIDFEGFDTGNVTSMDRMFAGCEQITTLNLNAFDTRNVTDMYGMFTHCKQLRSLDVSSFDTSNVSAMDHIFHDCASIQTLDIQSFETAQVKSGDSMFYQCFNLQTLLFDPKKFDTGNMTSMYAMFARCDNLRSLDVSHFDTKNVKNMAYMFNKDRCLSELAYDQFDMSNVTDKTNMLNGTAWQE